MQAEAARYLAALRRQAEARGNTVFKVSDLYSSADSLDLAVPDMHEFLEELNYAGKSSLYYISQISQTNSMLAAHIATVCSSWCIQAWQQHAANNLRLNLLHMTRCTLSPAWFETFRAQ